MNLANEWINNDFTGHPRVLLLEDESLLAQGYQMALKEEGYGVDVASTGKSALDTMRTTGYDLLVADLRLPDMDGLDVIRQVRQECPGTRVIVITGYADISSAVEAFKTGATDYLAKPLTEEDFLMAVDAALQLDRAVPTGGTPRPDDIDATHLIGKQDIVKMLEIAGEKPAGQLPVIKNMYAPAEAVHIDQKGPRPCDMQPSGHSSDPLADPLFHQDKMMSLGRLTASVVHEINNPLSGILNYIRLMIKILGRGESLTADEMEKFTRFLNLVESEVSRCASIVSGLLAFSRKSEVCYGEVNIGELLEKCMMLSRHKLELNHLHIEMNLAENLPKVWGDFNQIQQCIINLIFNAIDAMDRGGTLKIESWHSGRDNRVSIRVADDGCGISEEDRKKIFDPFFTTKQEGKGLGLGLSTVSHIIGQHGGTIDVDSAPGKGTAFTITLPEADTKPSAAMRP